MELKDFVKNTILDIVNGVREAQEEDTSGASIVPRKLQTSNHSFGEEQTLHFDIAIEEISTKSGGGKVGVSTAGLNGELARKRGKDKTETSRVQFDIQIRFKASDY